MLGLSPFDSKKIRRKLVMYYSEKEKWAFIHIPKNAGTTLISHALRGRGKHSRPLFEGKGNGSPHHNKYTFFEKHGLVKDKEAFAIVRNPWSRALSLYLFTIKHCQVENHRHHAELTQQGFKNSWMKGGFFMKEDKQTTSLRQWCNRDTQISWLRDRNGKIAADWYRMEDQLMDVEKKYNCDMSAKVERTATDHGHYSMYYDDELKARIAELYAEDIEIFGYSFDKK
jgi:hypothetical protein